MPGERLEDAMAAATAQQAQGVGTIFTRLGENLTRVEEAEEVTTHYLDVLDKVERAGLRAQISVKPTQLGLDLDKDLCFRNLQRLVARADARGNFVWIDMESSPYVDPTLDLFRRARAQSPRVGIALQAYLHRTANDVETLVPLGAAIRLVKGAYLEPASVAFPKKADVDSNFYALACRLLADDAQRAGGLLHIATHDPVLADRLAAFIDQRAVPTSACTGSPGTCAALPSGLRMSGSWSRVFDRDAARDWGLRDWGTGDYEESRGFCFSRSCRIFARSDSCRAPRSRPIDARSRSQAFRAASVKKPRRKAISTWVSTSACEPRAILT